MIVRTTINGNETFDENVHRLFATYYFYHTELKEHTRIKYNFLGVLSTLGGLISIFNTVIGIVFVQLFNY